MRTKSDKMLLIYGALSLTALALFGGDAFVETGPTESYTPTDRVYSLEIRWGGDTNANLATYVISREITRGERTEQMSRELTVPQLKAAWLAANPGKTEDQWNTAWNNVSGKLADLTRLAARAAREK